MGHRRAWRAAAATLAPAADPGRAHDRLADLPLSARNGQIPPGGNRHDHAGVRGSRDRRRPECWIASRHRASPTCALFARARNVIERKAICPGGASSKPPDQTHSPSPRSAHHPAPPDERHQAPSPARTQLLAPFKHRANRAPDPHDDSHAGAVNALQRHDDSHPGSINARFQLRRRIVDGGAERQHQRIEPARGPERFGRCVRARVLR